MTIVAYFVIFIGIFYVFAIMPRRKQEKKHSQLMDTLKKGEKVVTIGGIKGTIARVKDETIMLKVNDDTEIEFIKKAIAYREGEE
ncbi:MAG: preprotein translocase subunit YajC [Syntrophomonadaceae bacterium]|nr:preprotein translocase subunit YajC [Syntrophomonadaceae bacterium]